MKYIVLILLLIGCTPKAKEVVEVPNVTVLADAPDNLEIVTTKKVKRLDIEASQVVLLNTQVTEQSVNLAINQLTILCQSGKELHLLIDSPGGSVFDGNRLISFMEGSRCKINTVVTGLAASMGAQIHAHGVKRYAIDRTILMYHQAAGGLSGNIKGMKHLLAFIDREVRKDDAYIAKRAGLTPEAFDRMIESDLWLAADDALAMNLVDELVHVTIRPSLHGIFDIQAELKKRNIPIKQSTTLNPLTEIY